MIESTAGRAAGLLLAAGAGRRYGKPKALVEYEGLLLVERAAAVLRDGDCSPVTVVLGAAANEVVERADLGKAVVIINKGWSSGMGSSLRAGLDALTATDVDAAVVLLVDLPGVTAAAVRRLAARAEPSALAAATYHARRGHPVLIGRDHWEAVSVLATGEVGARRYLDRHSTEDVPCDDVAHDWDLDYPA